MLHHTILYSDTLDDMDELYNNFTSCDLCPSLICLSCDLEGNHEYIAVKDNDGLKRCIPRCKHCINENGLLPKSCLDECDRYLRRKIDEQIYAEEDEEDDVYEYEVEEMQPRKKKASSKKKVGKKDASDNASDDGNGGSDDDEEEEVARTKPNMTELKAALSSRLLGTKHSIKAGEIRSRIKNLFPNATLDDEAQVGTYLEDEGLRALGEIHFGNLESKANATTARFNATSISDLAEDAIPLFELIHTQHCIDAECSLCLDGKSQMGLTNNNIRQSSCVKKAIELFQLTYRIAKDNLVASNGKKTKLKKKGAKLLEGNHVEHFGYDPEKVSDLNCEL